MLKRNVEKSFMREISNKIGNYNCIHNKKNTTAKIVVDHKYASIKEETTVNHVKNKYFKESVKIL